MQHAMHKRREQHGDDADKGQSRKQSVTRRENFCRVRRQRIDWTHSSENHRCIQERIDPAQVRYEMITDNTDSKSKDQNSKRDQPVSSNTFEKFNATQQRLSSALVHVGPITLPFDVRYQARRFSAPDNPRNFLYNDSANPVVAIFCGDTVRLRRARKPLHRSKQCRQFCTSSFRALPYHQAT